MRYCIFTANYLPNLGGVERYTYNLAQELAARGNKVTIVTSNVFSLPEREHIGDINVLRVPCWNVLAGRFPVLRYNADFRALDRHLREQNFDFVIVQTRFYIHSLYGVSFAKRQGIPCITIEHGTNHFTVNNRFLDFCGHIYEHWVSAMVRRRCCHFYGVSKDCCQWLRHFKIQPEGVLYNAIDLEDIQAKSQAPVEDYRQLLCLEGKTLVTYAGRLVREKGILKLVEAITHLQKEHPDLILAVAGDGNLYEELATRQLPGVYMLGRLDFDHVVALLNVTHVFCLPTDYPEGFPTAVLEAAACGCYIITTTRGGSKELLTSPDLGAVLTENTAENIAQAIQRVIVDPAYRQEAVGKTYQRLCENFTWKSTADKVIELAKEWNHD